MRPELLTAGDEKSRRLVEQTAEMALLAGGLAHEIKNPLSTIQLNLGLLAEDFENTDSPRDQRSLKKIRIVEGECQRLNDILEDFLRFVRVQDLRLALADLNGLVSEMIEFIAPEAATRGIELVPYLHSGLPPVLLDRELFKQALLNLLINAQQAMPSGGQIVLQTRPVGAEVELAVIDTGDGMSAETRAKIFQPFYSTKRNGSGLGLPAAKRIIEHHHGRITVQSELGRGTQFTIALPNAAK